MEHVSCCLYMFSESFSSLTCQCRYAYQVVLKTLDLLRSMPSLVDVDVPNGGHFTVCGDVHGQVRLMGASLGVIV